VHHPKSLAHHTISPRLGLAIPIGDVEHLSFHYGWFYELPPFYYLYLNNNAEQEAFWPILGNVNLKPLRAVAWEVTYRRAVSRQSVFSLSGFFREYKNLLDTEPHKLSEPASIENPATAFRYANNAKARISGFEAAFKRDFGKGLAGALTHTYSRSVGTASWPETSFLTRARGQTENGRLLFPLAWDQRHSVTLNMGYQKQNGLLVNLLAKFNGPATVTEWLTSQEHELPWRHDIDLKISAPLRWGGIRLEPFVEIRNLLDERYLTPGDGGLDLSQPITPFQSEFGRRIWVGIVYR
jgi:outer membrane receptor protein involved in Fe transport